MKIKVCGMKEARNIAEVARLQPDYMGFIFYSRSPRFAEGLPPDTLEALPPETLRAGVFVNAARDYVARQAARYRLDLLQLHGDETPDDCARLKSGYKIIKAFGIQSEADFAALHRYEGVCDYFLLDTKTPLRGGSGEKFDHRLLVGYRSKTPFFLSGGIAPGDAANLADLRLPCCEALDVNSCFEASPGVKNVAALQKFIEAIRAESSRRSRVSAANIF
ncbi:MAG: phosphoribosylanthranilate isomerase [Prevotellaceae bacterium]|jgi:phosphoribosylanthranilate isomerase|nr:phosphoribosylanthranilate isomerase [Prevotellaceae bacterium]